MNKEKLEGIVDWVVIGLLSAILIVGGLIQFGVISIGG
jgi:hypothetical protein